MISFGQLVAYARSFDAQSANLETERVYDRMCRALVETLWHSRNWPFHYTEASLRLYAPFQTGTVALVKGATTCVHSAAGFLSAVWPTPALLMVDARNETYRIATWNSGSSATLDAPFLGESGDYTFQVQFAYNPLPADFLEMRDPWQPPWWSRIRPISHEQYVEGRDHAFGAGSPQFFAIVGGDGLVEPKIAFLPAPDVDDQVRFIYRHRPPACVHYRNGTINLTEANAAVTGVGTLWQKSGFSAAGLVLELPDVDQIADYRRLFGTVNAATTDTALTLTAPWGGPTIVGANYALSDRLKVPDEAWNALSHWVHKAVWELRADERKASYFEARALDAMRRLGNATGRQTSAREFGSLWGGACGDDERNDDVALWPRTFVFNGVGP